MLTPERLKDIVAELLTRPGHEKVRTLVYDLLVNGLGATSWELDFERHLPEVRGRADALLGRTVWPECRPWCAWSFLPILTRPLPKHA